MLVNRKYCLVIALLLFTASPAMAQRGPGGGFPFGGRGPGGGGALGEIENEGTRTELGISEDQYQKLREIGESSQNRDQFGDMFERMRAAESEEDREKVRNEMRATFEKVRTESEQKMKTVLSEQQFNRLNQIQLHRSGARALSQTDVADSLTLTDVQKEQLTKLNEERDAARREAGFRMSDEDRVKFDEEWNGKMLSILTPEQKQKWTEKLGPPPTSQPQFGRPSPAPTTSPQRTVIEEEVPADAQVMTSFGQPAAPTGEKVPVDQRTMSFNFRYAPWKDVLKLFAEQADLSLDLNALPPGTFNYFDTNTYTPTQALDIINGYLLPKGFCLVRRNEFLVCVNIDEPIPPNLIPQVLPTDLDQRGNNELLTVLFPLEGVDVGEVAVEVNEIKGPQGKVVGLKSTNSVLVTDIGSNLRRIRAMLADVTLRGGPEDITFKAYSISNIGALEAEQLLRSLLGLGGVTNVSAMNDGRSRSTSTASSKIQITTDERTNQLLVTAAAAGHKLIEDALKIIDVAGEASSFAASNKTPFFQVYTVASSSDAREVVKTIEVLMPGIVVNEDGRNGKIHIFGNTQQHQEVTALIRQMDGSGGTQQMAVIPLAKLDPINATATIRSMFLKEGEAAPTIEPDMLGRQLMVRGEAGQITEIKALLAQLGEDGTGQRAGDNQDRIRSLPLSGRDPQEILPLIEKMWGQSSKSPIRIVTPDERGRTIRGIKTPQSDLLKPVEEADTSTSEDEQLNENEKAKPQAMNEIESPLRVATQSKFVQFEQAQLPKDPDAKLFNELENFLDAPAQVPQNQPTTPQAATSTLPVQPKSNAEVNLMIVGDELMYYSADPNALDELEAMLESTMRVIPPRTSWTVFTLKSADAEQTALMLEQLFPNSSVSSSSSTGGMFGGLTSSVTDLGSGLMDMTGLGAIGASSISLTIIPDARLNALFVSGPISQVREVEEMLNVLDASEWPDSFRDKFSRMIAIEHADAKDVFDLVEQTYKVYLDEQKNEQQQRGNPLAAMMGGGGRNAREEQAPPPAKLALSVDTNTNHLIVWADETLFREIETLVTSLDEAAQVANRTIRVVPLQNTNSTVITKALGTLMPRVNVSTTNSRTSSSRTNDSSSSQSSQPQPQAQPQQQDQEQIRRFFEQRMQERMQGGGAGGSPAGAFPGGGRPGGENGGRPDGNSSGGRRSR